MPWLMSSVPENGKRWWRKVDTSTSSGGLEVGLKIGLQKLDFKFVILPVFRRLEVLLDRSWEKESITWTGLTWWDPLPCGQDFVVQVQLSSALISYTIHPIYSRFTLNFFPSLGYKVSSTLTPFSCPVASLQSSHSEVTFFSFDTFPFTLAS